MSKAEPLLEESEKVLKSLKKDDIVFISSIKQPTATIVLGTELCCHMFGLKPKKTNLGKVQGDTNGYFDLAKGNLLNNPNGFL